MFKTEQKISMYTHKWKFRKNITNSPKLLKALTSSLEARLSARIFKLSEDLMAVAIWRDEFPLISRMEGFAPNATSISMISTELSRTAKCKGVCNR